MTAAFRVVYLADCPPPEAGLPAYRINLPDSIDGHGSIEQHSGPHLGRLQIEELSLPQIIQCCRRLETTGATHEAKGRIDHLGKLEPLARKNLSAFYDRIETTAKDGGSKLASVRDISKKILAEQGIPEGPGEAIIQSVRRIFETRTIFLLPEIFVSNTSRQPKNASQLISKFEELIELWAENSVHAMRESSAGLMNFAFAYFNEPNRPQLKSPARAVIVPDLLSRKQLTRATKILGNSLSQMKRPGPVLLEGRTGSGKSTAAQIYAEQDSIPVVKINVSSTPKELIEARLRGFIKGSFTGAINDQAGWFEQAENGVLFLDEFQQAPEHVQTQLLDILDATSNWVSVSKINEENQRKLINVKTILAINEPIETLVREKRLREDLLHRIRTRVQFPTLKDLLNTTESTQIWGLSSIQFISLLAKIYAWKNSPRFPWVGRHRHFADEFPWSALFCELDSNLAKRLQSHSWPGNFRELEKVVADAIFELSHTNKSVIDSSLIPLFPGTTEVPIKSAHAEGNRAYEIEQALRREDFCITRATKHLKDLKLGSVNTLRSWIIRNHDLLSRDVREHRKIASLLR